MANTVKSKKRKFLIECIELYRDLPALWQVKHKLYHDREQKSMAYDRLLAKYNKMFPEATREDLKRKFNSLRTNYRKELRRVNCMKTKDPIYVSTLWYFEDMSFLRDHESADSEFLDANKVATNDGNVDTEEQRPETLSIDESRDSTPGDNSPTISRPAPKKARRSDRQTDVACDRSRDKDEYYHWAMACAADLRQMERTQQFYAKKAIADIILEGQLGLLNRQSVQINDNARFASTFSNPTPCSSTHSNTMSSPEYHSSYGKVTVKVAPASPEILDPLPSSP